MSVIDNPECVRIILHDQTRMPYPDEEGYTASPGTLYSLPIEKKRTVRIPGGKSNCVVGDSLDAKRKDDSTSFYPVFYSQLVSLWADYLILVVFLFFRGDRQIAPFLLELSVFSPSFSHS